MTLIAEDVLAQQELAQAGPHGRLIRDRDKSRLEY